MKKIVPLLALMIFLVACDSPRSQRSVLTSSKSGSTLNTGDGVNFSQVPNRESTPESEETPSTENSNIPSDAKHCKFSSDGVNGFESSSTHLGAYTLCQSSSDKNSFYMQIKTPPVGSSGDASICFIPHTSSGTNSIYVGNPMCGTFPDPKQVKKITFIKYAQYSSALINSVMFFKDTSYYYPAPYNRYMMTLDAYKTCMNSLSYGNRYYCDAYKSVNQYVVKTF